MFPVPPVAGESPLLNVVLVRGVKASDVGREAGDCYHVSCGYF